MTSRNDDLEPIEPRTAQQLYLDHKETDCSEATVQAHRYKTNHFVEWCEENDVDNLNDVTGRDVQTFRLWLQEQNDLQKITLRTHLATLRVFLKWAGSIEAVPPDLYDKVLVPSVSQEDRKRDETLDAERAREVLEHLSTFEYASERHVVLALLWKTGIRIGAAKSLDVSDVDFENGRLRLVHRPDEGTQLKNGHGGERLLALSAELSKTLGDYIDEVRVPVQDDHGREPLLTTRRDRMSRATMRRFVYTVTAPCFLGDPCSECYEENPDRRCGDAVSPHAVRRGSITHHLTEDVLVDVVSDRMNVSRKTLEKHYDQRSEEVKVEQRREYLGNI